MNRRNWIKTMAAIPAALKAAPPPTPEKSLETETVRLKTKHTWTTTMSSSDYRDVLYVRWISAGITGRGEGAPIVRYKESAATATKAIASDHQIATCVGPMEVSQNSAGSSGEAAGRMGSQKRNRYRVA